MRNRPIFLLALAGVIMAAGCASTQNSKLAVCDGKHRRPANAYGTVLPTVPLPTASTAPASPSPPMKPAPPGSKPSSSATPGPMSALDPKSFDPCGRPA